MSAEGRTVSRQRGRYTTKACEECRRRRAKCDGKRPVCTRCVQWHVSCQYSIAEDGRRPASKTYVLLLRQRIESLEKLLERHGIDASEKREDSRQRPAAQMNGSVSLTPPEDASESVDDLAENFKGRLALDESLNFDQDGEMRYFGPASGRLQFQASSSNGMNGSAVPISASKQVSNSFGYLDPIDPITAGIGVPKDVQDHLIDLYFKWEQPWYAITDEQLFRDSMNSGGRYWTPLLHNCILALGSRYSDRLDVRSDPDDPNTAGKIFLEEAKPQLYREMERPSLTTIQALGLIGMAYIAMGADAAGWLHHGMANRLSLDMGLNLDPVEFEETNAMSQREIQLRRQIYWTLYCHDKLSSSYTGRICSMLDSQGAVNVPEYDDAGPDSPERIFQSLQKAMISVCRIQENITLSLWGPKPLLKDHQRPVFLKSCLLDLRSWLYDLPTELRIDRPNKTPQAYTLHMVYQTARILLAKPFIMQKPPISPTTKAETNDLAHSICRESARSICLVAQKYRHTFGSYLQSPITATHCTLSAALVLLDETENLATPSHRNKLALCLTVLDELSRAWYPAGHIGANLRKLCRSVIPDGEFPVEDDMGPFSRRGSLPAPLDLGVELPNVFDEMEFSPLVNPGNALANQLGLSVPMESLPVDYGFFDILNQVNWDRVW
ncbi:fungal-specific transcription factor domain-containing protein [Aspergillus avenaceus]|uniref:Fungal-specific transcription factor domain-containing protein n=1 Tax=Aspergillus avenaceus TaxID=36643 RepID=A0A5N6U8V0_ASPAV|nr:fungal-specific transcription factor domain-containing protein [Aspergillus avenaceus]